MTAKLTWKNLTGNRDERWEGNGHGCAPSQWAVLLNGERVGTLQQSRVMGWLVWVPGVEGRRVNSLKAAKELVKATLL